MKKLIFSMVAICAMLFFGFSTANAQDDSWSWSDKPSSLSISIGTPSLYSFCESAEYMTQHPGFNYTGSYAISYDYNVLRWLAVGGRVSYDGWYYNAAIAGDSNPYDAYAHHITAMMQLRFTYINREHVQLYSGLGFGMRGNIRQEQTAEYGDAGYQYGGNKYWYLGYAYSVVPIGVHVGNDKVYGLAEVSLGTESMMAVGVGFKL